MALITFNLHANETVEKVGEEVNKVVNNVGNTLTSVTDSVQPLIKKGAESFEEAITPYVEKVLSGVEDGVDFAKGEVPVIIKQYLVFESVTHGLVLLSGILLLFSIPFLRRRFMYTEEQINEKRKSENDYYIYYTILSNGKYFRRGKNGNMSIEEGMTFILGSASTIVGIVFIVLNLFDFIKVTFMPKLYLVEKFIAMVA